MKSFCDGHITSRFAFDPEPDNFEVYVEPSFKAQAEHDGLSLRLEKHYAGANAQDFTRVDIFANFKCGATCKFKQDNYQGECVCPEACQSKKCMANLKLRGYRYPTRGPGYKVPMSPKPGIDFWIEDDAS